MSRFGNLKHQIRVPSLVWKNLRFVFI